MKIQAEKLLEVASLKIQENLKKLCSVAEPAPVRNTMSTISYSKSISTVTDSFLSSETAAKKDLLSDESRQLGMDILVTAPLSSFARNITKLMKSGENIQVNSDFADYLAKQRERESLEFTQLSKCISCRSSFIFRSFASNKKSQNVKAVLIANFA
jgi:hypothetical protein